MSKLISIDWDYFMDYMKIWNGSYLENDNNIQKHWYRDYYKYKERGIDITRRMNVCKEVDKFWDMLKDKIEFKKNTKILLTESHKEAYQIAKEQQVSSVYSFDSHSDLGYEGLKSFEFELNCSNWLGKLLQEGLIDEANIIYGPYTNEQENQFDEINKKYSVNYLNMDDIKLEDVCDIIHICRSGCWSAPWLDKKLMKFVYESGFEFENIDMKERDWNPEKKSLAEQIDYMFYG